MSPFPPQHMYTNIISLVESLQQILPPQCVAFRNFFRMLMTLRKREKFPFSEKLNDVENKTKMGFFHPLLRTQSSLGPFALVRVERRIS